MTTRTAQLIGDTKGCNISLTWNNTDVFAGTVGVIGNPEESGVLAQWQTDTSLVGDIPLVICCNAGSLNFVNVYMNMIRPVYETYLAPEAEWSRYTPTFQELSDDLRVITDQQLEEKYGHPRHILRQWRVHELVIGIENHFVQPIASTDFTDTDGKLNVTINGFTETRHSLDRWSGPWHWHIADGDIVACNFRVDSF